MKQRLSSLLLALALTVQLLPLSALAEETQPAEEIIGQEELAQGREEAQPLSAGEIIDQAQLGQLAGGTYTLAADIVLDDTWQPVDSFSGTLDGDGYTITLAGAPVFDHIAEGGQVVNLLLAGQVTAKDKENTGALAKSSGGAVANCYSSVEIANECFSMHGIGSFVGQLTGTASISNCLSTGTVPTAGLPDFGGIAGVGTKSTRISHSYWLKGPSVAAWRGDIASCVRYKTADEVMSLAGKLNEEKGEYLTWGANDQGYPVPGGAGESGPETDKTALTALIVQAEAVTNIYTPASWTTFQATLDKAREVAAAAGSIQSEVDGAVQALTEAMDALVVDNTGATNREALLEAIQAAEGVTRHELQTPTSWAAFAAARTRAEEVNADPSATQEDITAATDALIEAQTGLKTWDAQAEEPGGRPVVEVKDAQGLLGMSPDNYYRLVADFTVTGSIPSLNAVLDGNGHTITLGGSPLFTTIGENGVIQNLGLQGTVTASQSRASASFADLTCSGRILNSYSRAKVTGKSVAAGLVGILEGGYLHNVYFSGTLSLVEVADTRLAGLVNNYKSGAIHSAYWLEAQSKNAVSEGKYVSASMGGLDVEDMRGQDFRNELNLNTQGGLAWGQDGDGLPYHGADQGYTPPPGTGTYQYPIFFQGIDDGGNPVGEKVKLDAEGVALTLADLNGEDDGGYLSMPDYEGPIKWTSSSNSLGLYYPDYDDTRRDRIFYATTTGAATITVTDGAEKDPTVLASFPAKVTKGSLKDVKYFVGDTELTQGGSFTLAGYQWSTVQAKALYLGAEAYMDVPANATSVSVSFLDGKKATASGRSFVFQKPGTAKLSASALGRTITFTATSKYVPVESILPGVNQTPPEPGSPEAKYKDEAGNYVLHERNPNSASLVDFNKLQDTPNVHVTPANASYAQHWSLTSSDPSVAQFVDSLVVRVVPYKAGQVTFTATAKDETVSAEEQKVGTATAKFVYWNPVTALQMVNGNALTVTENQTQDLGLRLVGPKSAQGYHVSEAKMDWSFTSEDGGQVEIFRPSECVFVRGDVEYYVSNDQYQIRGLTRGTVTAVGTPVDQTGNAQPITLTIKVGAGEAEVPADLTAQTNLGITTGLEYLVATRNERAFAYNDEWEIFTLLRSGAHLDGAALAPYLDSVEATFKNPTVELRKPTTLARVAITLTAAGEDPSNFRGINFFALLGDNDQMETGGNEPMWALIALDTKGYEAQGMWSRSNLIAQLLSYQNAETGGFGLTDNVTTGVDITAMAIQALAPYYTSKDTVKTAVDQALEHLRSMQNRDGGFDGNCESTAQVLAALCALGLDPMDEANGFVKGINRNLVMSILSYREERAPFGFRHIAGTLAQNMTTCQAVYCLAAYARFLEGQPFLYTMTDLTAGDALAAQVRYAGRFVQGDFTPKSFSALAVAVAAAQALLDQGAEDVALVAGSAALFTAIRALVRESSSNPENPDQPGEKTLTATFRLIGDGLHTSAEEHKKYQTWIKTKTYTLPKGSTVYDLFQLALDDHGLAFKETQHSYIGAIQAPAVLGGYWLGEFSNGFGSGWKYLVNGEYPGVGLRSKPLAQGDAVIWRYVDEYREDYDNTDKWQEAPDVAPTAADRPSQSQTGATGPSVKVEAELGKDGVATAMLKKETVTALVKTIQNAEDVKGALATVLLSVPKGAKGMELTLPKQVLAALGKTSHTGLEITSSAGSVTLSPAALATAIQGADGGELTLRMTQADSKDHREETKTLVGGRPVYEITLKAGKASISQMEGEAVITLPYALAEGEDAHRLTVYYIDPAGKAAAMEGAKYDRARGGMVFATTHFSAFAIGQSADKADVELPFTDVNSQDWFYEAAVYTYANQLFQGTAPTLFSPGEPMTRAMLFSVLWRLEGEPAAEDAAPFDDVEVDSWYAPAVSWAVEQGLTAGTGAGFAPQAQVSREQIATMLYRYGKIKGWDVTGSAALTDFVDGQLVAPWAVRAMEWAGAAQLITGKEGGRLDPQGTATRAEVAVLLWRMADL